MYQTLVSKINFSPKLPTRAKDYEALKQVLLGTIYDNLSYPFFEERDWQGKPILIKDRKPAVDVGLGLIKNTVDYTVEFTFGEGRFPEIDCDSDEIKDYLLDLIKEASLFQVMQESMFWGSIGSSAIHLFVSENNRIHFKVYQTQYLTPVWRAVEPDELETITERYIVTGADLMQMGYNIKPERAGEQFWFQRIWDDTSETWYNPWPVVQVNPPVYPTVDETRTVKHNLGMVPWVWLKNLKGGDEIDGMSTFRGAIKAAIEIDYLLSQSGRGLKYMSDPTLVIVDPGETDEAIFKSASSAIVLGKDGKAEILEMAGTGHATVLEQVKALREAALEAMSGNRSAPEKMSAAQSGAALAQLWMPCIMLAGDLRNNYGEKGLLQLLKMVLKIGSTRQLRVNGTLIPLLPADEMIALRWGPYFEPTAFDLQQQAITLSTLVEARILSQKTAVKILANEYAIEDVELEVAQINAETALNDQREIRLAQATKPITAPNQTS